jgi:antitoxin HicB
MSYLAVIEIDGRACGGLVPELNVSAVGKSPEAVQARLEQGVALMLLELRRAGLPVPEGMLTDLPAELAAEFPGGQVLRVKAAPFNPVSLEIERAIQASRLSQAEIARRMHTSQSAVHKLQDYFYWGHSFASIQRLADVLGVQAKLQLGAA